MGTEHNGGGLPIMVDDVRRGDRMSGLCGGDPDGAGPSFFGPRSPEGETVDGKAADKVNPLATDPAAEDWELFYDGYGASPYDHLTEGLPEAPPGTWSDDDHDPYIHPPMYWPIY